jgi:hypothetical protein
MRGAYRFFGGKSEVKDHLENTGVDGRLIFK